MTVGYVLVSQKNGTCLSLRSYKVKTEGQVSALEMKKQKPGKK